MCCVFDGIGELFGETIRSMFGETIRSMFVNQFAVCLGVVAILLLNV